MPTHDIPLNTYGSTAGREHLSEKPRPKSLTVDLHNHLLIKAGMELVAPHLPDTVQLTNVDSQLTDQIRKRHAKRRDEHRTNIDLRVNDMAQMGLDVMAVSCMPSQFYYAVEGNLGAESSEVVNDGIVAAVKKHPTRLTGIGTVPLQDTDLAIKELNRCVNELGFRGIMIGCRVHDEELSAERLEPFWERCEELGVLILVHPSSFESPRLGPFHLGNIIGNPLDTTVAMHYLIFDGVMARYPKIKFYISHGGAFASAYSARMDHAYGAREDCRNKIFEKPSTYMKRFYYDTVVFSVDQLDYLIRKYGADHIALGTDYAADMAEYDPVEHVFQVPGLSESERQQICGLNALDLLNLSESDFKG